MFTRATLTDIKILLQSGAGAKADAITTFQVTDACTPSFDHPKSRIRGR